jgi:hypothetical protein
MIEKEEYLKSKKIVQEYEKQLNISDVISSKINENQSEMEREIQNYIKNNLKLKIREESNSSDVSYSNTFYIDLILNDEVISSEEIPGLGEDY